MSLSDLNQFDAPEKFDRESRKNHAFQKHLGDLVIAPVYVQRRCDEDKENYEVSVTQLLNCLRSLSAVVLRSHSHILTASIYFVLH